MSEIIHKSEIKKMLSEKSSEVVLPILTPLGFEYKKSNNSFVRKKGDFNQRILISGYSSEIEYDEFSNRFHLNFRMGTEIALPKYTKWVQKRESSNVEFTHRLSNDLFYMELDESEVLSMSTYEPSSSQSFKNSVSRSISKALGSVEEEKIEFKSSISSIIQNYVSELEAASDIIYLYNNRRDKFDMYYLRLLEYYGEIDLGREIFQQWLEYWRNLIETSDEINENNLPVAVSNYNKFVEDTNRTFNSDIPLWVL